MSDSSDSKQLHLKFSILPLTRHGSYGPMLTKQRWLSYGCHAERRSLKVWFPPRVPGAMVYFDLLIFALAVLFL